MWSTVTQNALPPQCTYYTAPLFGQDSTNQLRAVSKYSNFYWSRGRGVRWFLIAISPRRQGTKNSVNFKSFGNSLLLFICRVVSGKVPLVWKGPLGEVLTNSSKHSIVQDDDGVGSLTVHNCDLADVGEYYCIVPCDEVAVSSSARLSVSCEFISSTTLKYLTSDKHCIVFVL